MARDLSSYRAYTWNDYLEDSAFRRWLEHPDAELDTHWQAVFERYPKQRAVAEEARRIWEQLQTEMQPAALRTESLDDDFIKQLRQNVARSVPVRPLWKSRRGLRWVAAASVVLLLALGLGWGLMRPTYETVRTAYGEWKQIYLPDGSKVQLNANSELTYQADWQEGESRELWLEGEAFFEVGKDSEGTSFTVHAGELAIVVLGTAFNVNRRTGQTEVYLQEGSVRLQSPSGAQVIEPGELAIYSEREKRMGAIQAVPAEAHISWKDGVLIIQNKPVRQILQRLEEIYGFTFVPEDTTLLDDIKTVAVPMDDLELALPILERVLGAELKVDGNIIQIK